MKEQESMTNEEWPARIAIIIFVLIGGLIGSFLEIALGLYVTIGIAIPLAILVVYAGPLKDWTFRISLVEERVSETKHE